MLRLLAARIEIEAAHDLLKARFASSPSRIIPVTISYHPKDLPVDVRWFPDHHFWVFFDPDDRMLFGLSEANPRRSEKVSLSIEFAVPHMERYKFLPGAFAEDEYGNLFLVHRGGFGGGKKGIGRKTFLQKFRGRILTVRDREKEAEVALVGALGSTQFLTQVSIFLNEVDRMRKELL